MKKAICLLAAILVFSGCSLGDVKEKGASCPPKDAAHDASLGIIGGVECSETDCVVNDVDYTENIQFGYCPVEFSQCGYDSAKDVYYCAKIACEEDEHIYDDDCERDTLRHCGSHENDCKQLSGWKSGKCTDKQCVAEECVDGYEVFKGKCKAKSTDCDDGEHYYSEGSKCEKNSLENCGSHGNNCAELSGWKDGDCSSGGVCLAIDCDSGYELKSGKCVALTTCPEGQHLFDGTCEEDSLQHCGNHETDCTKVTGWGDGSCTNKKCSATACADEYVLNGDKCEARTNCPEGQHLYLGTCESDSIQNCGGHDKDCTSIAGWGGGDCVAGNCSATACLDGYELNGDKCEALTNCPEAQHIYNGKCVDDSVEQCGSDVNNCVKLSGWKSGQCVNQTCVADACVSGYCLNNGQCADGTANSNACGISGGACQKCTGNDVCKSGICSPVNDTVSCTKNQHVYNNICEDDSLYNCGTHGRECKIANAAPTGQDCVNGQCIVNTCIANYHVYKAENRCEPDDTDNCGSHGNKCSGIANANGYVCESKTCKPKACLGDNHVYQTICEPNSLENCGSHGNPCNRTKVSNSSDVTCTNTKGVCKATKCYEGYKVSEGICSSICPSKAQYYCSPGACCARPNCAGSCIMAE